ncbi:MAG: hypothetical protein JWO82_165 [Akkermansiaceae bacterium]|nr:hypothetical protein [Akkermansiaceae bacterium]
MPFTLSHPAAILPLVRFFKPPVLRLALVIGSMSPDLGYYAHWFTAATWAHSLAGSLLLATPSGLLLLGGLFLVRPSLLFLMPSRQRRLLARALSCEKPFQAGTAASLCLAVWIGALTHLFWDSFTHPSGWFVAHLPLLQMRLTPSLPIHYILQQLSTLTGAGLVMAVYFRLISAQPVDPDSRTADRKRWAFWSALLVISLALACLFNIRGILDSPGLWAVRVFLFRTATAAGGIFVALAFLSVVVIQARHSQAASRK